MLSRVTLQNRIDEANPGFNRRTSSLRAMLDVIERGLQPGQNINVVALQQALDGIPPDKARQYRFALRYVIFEVNGVCYTGVESFTPRISYATSNVNMSQTAAPDYQVVYSSAKFEVTARLYCIGPQVGGPDIGFIQHCDSKTCESTYSDGSAMRLVPDFHFPIGDSSGPGSQPFYHRGVSFQCAQPAVVDLSGVLGHKDLEMSDWFMNNGFPSLCYQNLRAYDRNAMITGFSRNQVFTLWLARRWNSGIEHLMRKVSYELVTTCDLSRLGAPILRTNASRLLGNTSTPAYGDRRPPISAPMMNGAERWHKRATRNGAFVRLV